VFVGTASALTITIEHNIIYSNTNGIFLTGPVSTAQIDHNLFFGDTTDIVGP
jgi:parallel beta-helix repeat protein